jgi:diguanylate cyclase (GGDEF)-like protein
MEPRPLDRECRRAGLPAPTPAPATASTASTTSRTAPACNAKRTRVAVIAAAITAPSSAVRHVCSLAITTTPADRDHLTGLWNRRRFEKELDRSRQNSERLALLSIDVDGYNDVIDRHGAGAAEGLIRSISDVLSKLLRPNETLARMGGDEFGAVLRDATPQFVQSLADGLCAGVREQSHAVGSSRVDATISIGGAFLDAGTQTHHEALLAADTGPLRGQGRRRRPSDPARVLAWRLGLAVARSQDEPAADARRDPARRASRRQRRASHRKRGAHPVRAAQGLIRARQIWARRLPSQTSGPPGDRR